jgi:hypothetical protein
MRHETKIVYDDDRGTVDRGFWDVTKDQCSTEQGIMHPKVKTGATFVVTAGEARATAWFAHEMVRFDPAISLDKENERQGHIIEMIMRHGSNIRLSVGYRYDDVTGEMKHVSFNREDSRGFPSSYWGKDNSMHAISAQDLKGALGLTKEVDMVGRGHQIEIPVKSHSDPLLQQIELTDIKWTGHLMSLAQADKLDTAILKLPDKMVVLAPLSIPFGQAWSAAYLWRPTDSDVVHTLETRYTASGAFDCFCHAEFMV